MLGAAAVLIPDAPRDARRAWRALASSRYCRRPSAPDDALAAGPLLFRYPPHDTQACSLLVTPALRFVLIRLDQYGFYRIGDFGGTHLPHMLLSLVGVILGTVCALTVQLLWTWQDPSHRAERSAPVKAAGQ